MGLAKNSMASGLLWILAQFGSRDLVHNWLVHLTHLKIPLQETGAFNLFAWQAMWTVGLWLGGESWVNENLSAKSLDGLQAEPRRPACFLSEFGMGGSVRISPPSH